MSYEFSARGKLNARRPRLLSAWTLAGFAMAVLILLALIFPKYELVWKNLQEKLGDPLSTNYLVNLLRTDPENLKLRLLLAEHKIFLGELTDVPAILEPVLHSSDAEWQMRGQLAEYKYLTRLYNMGQNDADQQLELLQRRRELFLKLAQRSWSMQQTLVYLASQANELKENDVAHQLYRQITQDPGQMSAAWYAAGAAREQGEGHYELTSLLYFMARQEARQLASQREYFFAGIKALMANSMFIEAMVSGDLYLGNLADDHATLYFLAQNARMANDTARANRYARKMLHLSWMERAADWYQRLQLNPIGTANAASEETMPAGFNRMRPYDQKSYQLAYDIFLGNGNLADAYLVAESAVRQVPQETAWHKRLAQVAEWYGKPEIALREWSWLSRHGGGEAAMLEVLRLAPGLSAYDTLIDVWKERATKRSLDEAQWRALADLYEQAGSVSEGIHYFEAQYARKNAPLLLELAARLAQRSGEDELANRLYWALINRHGINTERLLKVTAWYLQKGQYQNAYELLKKYTADADKKDFTTLKLLADLAWELQHDEDATENYRRLAASGNMSKEGFGRLIFLLGTAHQEEAAALAELAYQRFDDNEMLLKALEIHAARHDLSAQKRLFESVAAHHDSTVFNNPRFFMMRAQYFQATGNYQAARKDYFHSVAIAPNDVNAMNGILWFLIDAHEHAALREIIKKIDAKSAKNNTAYWGVLAAAYQELGQPARAIGYYTRQLRANRRDFLWLVGYADALEQNHQAGMAWRVRQQAWKQMNRTLQNKVVSPPFTPDLLAAARLTILNAPHDPALDLVRSVLRQDRLIKRDVAADHLTNEFVLGWAASKEQHANAKAWLWRRYGLSLKRPLWAEAMIALANNDTERLNHLIAEQSDGLSLKIRHDAALAIEQRRYAQSIVFDGLTLDPHDNEIHSRLSNDSLATASQINFEMSNEEIGSLHNIVKNIQIEIPVSAKSRLKLELGETQQSSVVPLLLGNFPSTERLAGLALSTQNSFGYTTFMIRNRNEYASILELGATHNMDITAGLNLKVKAEINAESTESNDLRVFGMRDQVDTSLRYAVSKSEYLRIQPTTARYYTQRGELLGTGKHFSWEAGHHVRIEYPDLTVRVTGNYARFASEPTAPLLLPGDADIYGVCLDLGKAYQLAYTRAWRPFFDYCATDNNVSGQGYNTTFGLAGSVAGHDHLAIKFHQGFGSLNVFNDLVRELTVHYRYYFDRY